MEISTIKLRNSYQICNADINNIFVKINSLCVLDTEHGVDIGRVVKKHVSSSDENNDVNGKLLRMVNSDDIKQFSVLESIEKKAYDSFREKSKAKNLIMKLISVKCLFDKSKIIFYFVADNRIDFRELVKELASVFKTRIEMRQIGVRDEARLVGGYGQCGRQHCCSHQSEDFDPVSIKMAKEQSLNLNSLKISGMCGRLLCCLGYEYSTYKELNKNLPKYGMEISADEKTYFVIFVDTLGECIYIKAGERVLNVSKHDLEFRGNKYWIKKSLMISIFGDNYN